MKVQMLLLSIIFSVKLFATEVNHLERRPGVVSCNNELELCTYLTQNLSARQLISKITPVMFGDMPLDPSEGFINKETTKKINFWFKSQELRERFIALVPRFDTLESFTPSSLVQFETEIFAVTDEGLSNIQARLGIGLGNSSAGNTGTDLGLNASFSSGDFALSMALTAARTMNQMKRVTTVRQILPNLSSLNFEDVTPIWVSPTTGRAELVEAGIKLKGDVSISRESSKRVTIKDFDFYYGVERNLTEDSEVSRVKTLKFKLDELNLYEGLSNIVVSVNHYEVNHRTSAGFPTENFWHKRSAKLMIITRARAFSFDDFVNHNREIRNLETYGHFSVDEVDQFPRSNVKIESLVDTLRPYIVTTLAGERILGFHFDKSLARKNNFSKNLKIKIKAKGFKQVAIRSVENLMLTGLKFDGLPETLFQEPLVKIKLKFKNFNERYFYPWKKTLYFNPETNEFIQ